MSLNHLCPLEIPEASCDNIINKITAETNRYAHQYLSTVELYTHDCDYCHTKKNY